jgi:hypothetical protein
MWRARSNIQRDIERFAFRDPAEFGLGPVQLIVKAAKCTLGGPGVIILNEKIANADFDVAIAVIRFDERTACITKDSRAEFKHAGQRCFNFLHEFRSP